MTNYISNINANDKIYPIGGDNFDGEWIPSRYIILNGATLSGGSCAPYSLSSYLPDDGYDYEVIFEGVSQSTATSGKVAQLTLLSGSYTTGTTGWRLGKCTARTSALVFCGGSAIIPIFASDKNISVYAQDSDSNNASSYVWATGYRRIGKND